MGIHENISLDKFPAQGLLLGKRVSVCFSYDTAVTLKGIIIRDDIESPHHTIILLDDGRAVLTTECMYSLYDYQEVFESIVYTKHIE